MIRKLLVAIYSLLFVFSLNAQNCPGYANAGTGTGQACGDQIYTLTVPNTTCNGEIYFTVDATDLSSFFGDGSWDITSVLTGNSVASGSGNGTISVGPLDPNVVGTSFNLVVTGTLTGGGNVDITQSGTTVASSGPGNMHFSANITISSATITIQSPSGPISSTVSNCKDFIVQVPLSNPNYCSTINVSLPWTIVCDANGQTISSGTANVLVYPTVPTNPSDLVDIIWDASTCSFDVTPKFDCGPGDIGTVIGISPDPSTVPASTCANGNQPFTVNYNGITPGPDCCAHAGPPTNITYDQSYVPSAPVVASSPFGGTNNSAYTAIPPNNLGGNATALNLCVDVTNFCMNPGSNGDATWYVIIFVDGAQIIMDGPITGSSHNVCIDLTNIPSGYDQNSTIDVYVLPNTFSVGQPPTNYTTYSPGTACGSLSALQWNADVNVTMTATYEEMTGSPVTCSDPISVPYTSCQSSSPTVAVNTPADCSNPSTVQITNYDNTFTYSLSPAGATVDGTGIISGTAGTYTLTASNGSCTSTASVTIDPVSGSASISTPSSMCGTGSTQALTGSPTGGTWSSSNTGVATVSGAGVVTAVGQGTTTITYNASGCVGTASVTVNPSPSFTLSSSNPSACGSSDGTITISGLSANTSYNITYNGVGPASMTSNASGEIVISGLSANSYTGFTVATASGCSTTDNSMVTLADPGSPTAPTINLTAASCTANGNATISNYDATATYTFSPSGPSVGSGGVISGENYGTAYTVTATISGCTSSASTPFTVDAQFTAPAVPTVTTTSASCTADGSATISNYNASNTYSFSPSGPTAGTGGIISGTTSGTSYTVTASIGTCSSAASSAFTVDGQLPTPSVVANPIDPTSCGGNGTINFTFTNVPDGTYTVSYATGTLNVTVSGGTGSASVPAGSYNNITITVGGCTSSPVSTTLTDPGSPATPTIATTSASCTADGTATINNYDASVTYTFSPVGPTVGTGGVISGLTFGQSYTVTASLSGCTSNSSNPFSVDEMIATPTLSATSTNPVACGGDGTINFTFTNVPNGNYTINYDSGTLNVTVSGGTATANVPAGAYNNMVIAIGACSSSPISVSLSDPNPPAVPLVDTTSASCTANGTATISNYNASASYTFSPVGPSVGANGEIANLSAGTSYTITSSVGGCTSSASSPFIIEGKYPAPTFTVTTTRPICLTKNGEINIVLDNSSPTPVTYSIGNGVPDQTGNGTFSDLSAGNYTISVTDGDGCVATDTILLAVDTSSLYIDAVPNSKSIPLGASVNVHLFLDPNAAIDTMFWSPTDGLSCSDCIDFVASPDSNRVYYITVTDTFGCTVRDSVIINIIFPCSDIFVPNTFSPNADGNNDFNCVFGDCIISMDFTIYNRWGESVFHSTDQDKCWDGKFRGKYVQTGAYVYKLKALLKNGKRIQKSGSITVVR